MDDIEVFILTSTFSEWSCLRAVWETNAGRSDRTVGPRASF